MVKKLRYKFVAITMSLMVFVFGAMFFAGYLYLRYWNEFDTLQALEWLADAGVFQEDLYEIISEMGEDKEKPIYYVMMDKNGNVVSSLGRDVPKEVLDAIRLNAPEKWKWHSYIYTMREYENGQVGVYLTDTTEHPVSLNKIMGAIFLIGVVFLLLLAVSFYLSKYVVEPARKALEREKQFITDASHELKTPVAAISINAQALMGQIEDNKHLKYILSESERMDRLIHKLLTLSFLEGQKRNTPKKIFILSNCCEEAALTMESMAYEKKIKFYYEIEDAVRFFGNEDEMKQLISILLDNAMKHTFEKGEIRFSLVRKKGHSIIEVFNTGKGITQEDLSHIFERFYSTEKSRTEKTDSFGLGLSIAKAIVKGHDGKITVESEYGSYACFTVIL